MFLWALLVHEFWCIFSNTLYNKFDYFPFQANREIKYNGIIEVEYRLQNQSFWTSSELVY